VAIKKKPARKSFNSKLLLFGEHIINRGAKGLAIPTKHFAGQFDFIHEEWNDAAVVSNRAIQGLTEHIIYDKELSHLYDTNLLLTDLEHGLYFQSNIPQGYGLGSSGALVAALCERYRLKPIDQAQPTLIKKELASIECFFHGKSSGLDPLVCFLDKSVLIDNGDVKDVFDLTLSDKTFFRTFLINTEKPRQTAPLVKLFLNKCKSEKFAGVVDESLVKANDMCIKAFLKPGYSSFWKSLKLISQIHYDYMDEFIPEEFKPVWRQGLANNEFYLKICGAGGGGFILGFAKKEADIKSLLARYQVIELFDF
jgi:mevalonate kinase